MSNVFAAIWGVFGVAAVLTFAVVRLASIAWVAIDEGLNPMQWLLLITTVILMAWWEGYKGFQLRFSPRVAARALYLYRNELTTGTKLLAPLFCCGYFHASRRARRAAWLGTIGIVLLVLLVHQLSQPWRGILDAGVVAGLTWGTLSLLLSVQQAFMSEGFDHSPEMP